MHMEPGITLNGLEFCVRVRTLIDAFICIHDDTYIHTVVCFIFAWLNFRAFSFQDYSRDSSNRAF